MAKPQKIALWFLLALGGILGTSYGWMRFADTLSPWVLAETKSQAHKGVALFLVDAGSFAGSDTYFFVRDPAKWGTKPLRVGGPYTSDGKLRMERAVWSQDGSVIAVQVMVGQNKPELYLGPYWVNAYDFRNHKSFVQGATVSEQSKAIAHLLAERGGTSQNILIAPSAVGQSIGLHEAAEFDTSDPQQPEK